MQKNLGKAGAIVALALIVTAVAATTVSASPVITSAVINTRIWDDDPTSTLTTSDLYPASISISDTPTGVGYANLHNFRLSTNNFNAAQFDNGDGFAMAVDLTIAGDGQAEGGLQLSPWWSPDVDGRFNFRTTDGEIACFGGRLPFYSFTASQGLHYQKGETVRAGIIYHPNSLSSSNPASIRYTVTIDGYSYSSPELSFDEGNPAEGHGSWGALTPFQVGGHMQIFTGLSGAGNGITTTWGNIHYVPEPASLALLALGALTLVRRRS